MVPPDAPSVVGRAHGRLFLRVIFALERRDQSSLRMTLGEIRKKPDRSKGRAFQGPDYGVLTRFLSRFMNRLGFLSAHSRTRRTVQLLFLSSRDTSRSRRILRCIFSLQNSTELEGIRWQRGQPCQKQPSTNTASLLLKKTKSGFPKTRVRRRQPVIPAPRKS